MAFKLVIRHNLEQTADDFDIGDVRSFDQDAVSVGTDSASDCVVDSDELAGTAFRIVAAAKPDAYRIECRQAEAVYVNQQPVSDGCGLRSGDEIRCGHWTFRFQKVYRAVRQTRRADSIAILAKVLVAVMFICELVLVYWLPKQFQSAKILAVEIRRQETTERLDGLRFDIRSWDQKQDAGPLQTGARNLLLEELDVLGEYIRQHDRLLSRAWWDAAYRDLQNASRLLERINRNEAVPALPSLSIDQAVQALITPEEEPTFAEE